MKLTEEQTHQITDVFKKDPEFARYVESIVNDLWDKSDADGRMALAGNVAFHFQQRGVELPVSADGSGITVQDIHAAQ